MEHNLLSANDGFYQMATQVIDIFLYFSPVMVSLFTIAVISRFIGSFIYNRNKVYIGIENEEEKKFKEMREVFDDTERLLELTKEVKEIEKKHAKVWL